MMDSKNTLSAKQICDIIKECKNSGVTELTFGELHVNFAEKVQSIPENSLKTFSPMQVEQSFEERLEELKDEARLADPELYERIVLEEYREPNENQDNQ